MPSILRSTMLSSVLGTPGQNRTDISAFGKRVSYPLDHGGGRFSKNVNKEMICQTNRFSKVTKRTISVTKSRSASYAVSFQRKETKNPQLEPGLRSEGLHNDADLLVHPSKHHDDEFVFFRCHNILLCGQLFKCEYGCGNHMTQSVQEQGRGLSRSKRNVISSK